jgi:hypothetical protein
MCTTFIQWWMSEIMMQGMPICLMHINRSPTSQTLPYLNVTKIKTWCDKFLANPISNMLYSSYINITPHTHTSYDTNLLCFANGLEMLNLLDLICLMPSVNKNMDMGVSNYITFFRVFNYIVLLIYLCP